MGGAVSSGESNDELIDNLMDAEYIKTPLVEKVFRSVDRAFYYTKSNSQNPYQDLAWRNGNLHLSAPCIYSEVLENLQLEPGLSFLNIGSGTGYLSTMAGLMLGRGGINHGIELHAEVVEYARFKLERFKKSSAAVDIFELCEPQFIAGNCMDALPVLYRYDRIYCGAACPPDFLQVILDSLKIGGLTIVPLNDSLVRIKRLSESRMESKTLLSVSFASLVTKQVEPGHQIPLPQFSPLKLSEMCRAVVREAIRKNCVSVCDAAQESKVKGSKKKSKKTRLGACIVASQNNNDLEGNERVISHISVAYPSQENDSSSEGDRSSLDDLPDVPDDISEHRNSDSGGGLDRFRSRSSRSESPLADGIPYVTSGPNLFTSSDTNDDDNEDASNKKCTENNGSSSSHTATPVRSFSPSIADSDDDDNINRSNGKEGKKTDVVNTSSRMSPSSGSSSSDSRGYDIQIQENTSHAPVACSHKRNIRKIPEENIGNEANGDSNGSEQLFQDDDDLDHSASRVKRVCLNSHVSNHEESNSSNSGAEEDHDPPHRHILYLNPPATRIRPQPTTTELSEEYAEVPLPEVNHPVTVRMRCLIQSLPLPAPIKLYLNYNRSF